MPSRNLWDKNVPRVEYDHRARDTRLRLEHLERLLGKRDAAESFRYFGLHYLLLGNIAGNGRERDRRTESPNDRRPYHIGTPWPAPVWRFSCHHRQARGLPGEGAILSL